jgi:formiminotetrahydrofolate cyclodeaminase
MAVSDLVSTLAEGARGQAGGWVAGTAAALAAGAVAAAAREGTWDEAAGSSAQALALGARARRLADADAGAYAAATVALAERGQVGAAVLGRALEEAAARPLELADAAADVATLAAEVADRTVPERRPDAVCGALIAAAAARAAAHLVHVNLAVGPGDPRGDQAEAAVRVADEAATRAREQAG